MAAIRYIDESKFLGRETVEYVRLANDAILAIKQLEDGIKNPRPGWSSEDVERGRRSHELAIQLHRDELNRYAAKVEELNAQYGPRQGWSTQNSRQAVEHLQEVVGEAIPQGRATGGKLTYRERRERRMNQRDEWAHKREAKAEETGERLESMKQGIGGYDPNDNSGHEFRRLDQKLRNDVEMSKLHRQSADALDREMRHSVYSDDPDARGQLAERIANLKQERDRWKEINVYIRAHGTTEGLTLAEEEQRVIDKVQRDMGHMPGYLAKAISRSISKRTAEINRQQKRLETLPEVNSENPPPPSREDSAAGLLPTLHGQQVTLGDSFATNRNLSMPLTTQDFGEKAGPITTPPPKLDPGQSHFLPEAPGNALAEPEPAPSIAPDPPAEDLLFSAPMTEEESRRAGSGLETDAETGRTLTPSERWEIESNQPPPEPEAQPEKPAAGPQAEPQQAVKPPTEQWEIEANQPPPEPGAQPDKPTAELHPEPAQTVKPPPETDREPDEAAYQRARMDRDCPLPDGDACIAIVKPETLRTDAKLFQYKAETDDQGVSVKLADVKTWDPDLAGVAYVWERADGERFIVDGHQRLALAQRLRSEGQDPELLVKIWREADGYTPRTMRLSAAKKNIAEGSGTAVDAARVLREEPGLFDTLSQKNAIVRDAKGLARLDQDVFSETVEYVNAGHLPENVASLIAGVGADPALQRGALLEFVREQRRGHITRTAGANLLYAIRRNRLDEVEAKAQGTLTGFDVGAVRESAWRERAALQQGLVNAFRNDRRLFGEVVRGDSRLESVGNVLAEESNESELTAARANIEIFDRLANKRGPLADYLDAEAVRIKKRMDETGASRQGAAATATRDAARYLRPFLKTYIQDGGAALAGNLAAKEPQSAPAQPPTSGAATTTTPTAAPAPRRDRPRVTAAQVSQPQPPPETSAARQPVTAEAVKESGRRSGQARSTTRERIEVPAAEKCAAPPKGGSQRAQPKGKGGSPKTPRRTTRQSPFTPAEVRRFKQDIARSMKR